MGPKQRIGCLCLPFLALLCVGWADSWDEIRAAAGSVQTVQADFVQEKQMPILSRPLVSKGRFYFRTPRSLRWEYLEPVQSILVMHDGRVTRFVADETGWRSERGPGLEAMQIVLQEISLWLAGRFDENPSFEAQLESERRIVLTPRQEAFGAVIQRIVLQLGTQPGTIESVVIHESQDTFTRLTFNQTQLNPVLQDAVFTEVP